jgi:hypothetical protein
MALLDLIYMYVTGFKCVKILPLVGEFMIQLRSMLSSQIRQSTCHVPGCSIGCIQYFCICMKLQLDKK